LPLSYAKHELSTSAEAIQQMKSLDILPRLIEFLDYEELVIKSGAMKLLTFGTLVPPSIVSVGTDKSIISCTDLKRVGELGAIPKLLKIIIDTYDKVESLAMMALIVLECASNEGVQNCMVFGFPPPMLIRLCVL